MLDVSPPGGTAFWLRPRMAVVVLLIGASLVVSACGQSAQSTASGPSGSVPTAARPGATQPAGPTGINGPSATRTSSKTSGSQAPPRSSETRGTGPHQLLAAGNALCLSLLRAEPRLPAPPMSPSALRSNARAAALTTQRLTGALTGYAISHHAQTRLRPLIVGYDQLALTYARVGARPITRQQERVLNGRIQTARARVAGLARELRVPSCAPN